MRDLTSIIYNKISNSYGALINNESLDNRLKL